MKGFALRTAKQTTLALLGLLGAVIALVTYNMVASASITYGNNLGEYTYGSSDCHESDADAADPINVIFYDDATKSNLDYFFNLYHGWVDNGGGDQYFKLYGHCYYMEGQPSSGQLQSDRYHARYHRGLNASGGVDVDSLWGDYSVASPHYENVVLWDPPFNDCQNGGWPWNHAVPPDGFNEGRDNVINNWVTEGGHYYGGSYYWQNTEPRQQCNDWVAQSDGYVKFIRVRMTIPAPSSISSSFVYLGGYTYKDRLNWSSMDGAA